MSLLTPTYITADTTNDRKMSTSSTSGASASGHSTYSFKSALGALAKHAKEHHTSVQGAFEAYYGAGGKPTPSGSTTTSAAASKRPSIASARSDISTVSQKASGSPSTWSKVKKSMKDHHRAVNAAYGSYYGGVAAIGS